MGENNPVIRQAVALIKPASHIRRTKKPLKLLFCWFVPVTIKTKYSDTHQRAGTHLNIIILTSRGKRFMKKCEQITTHRTLIFNAAALK